MVTSYEAAGALLLHQDWQQRYQRYSEELLRTRSPSGRFTVCVVGRAGVGKGSLVNHLLQKSVAYVSHNLAGNSNVEKAYDVGNLKILDIPGYDGYHDIASRFKREAGSPEGTLSLENFVKGYRLFEKEVNALIFVINNRIVAHDRELMAMAVASGKFFCIVRTNTDTIAKIADGADRTRRLAEVDDEIRKALDLTKHLNIRIFKISIPWPQNKPHELEAVNTEIVTKNKQMLDFPELAAYLYEPRGLHAEILIYSFVKKEVKDALEPYVREKKRNIVLNFSETATLSSLYPAIGSVVLTFLATMINVVRAFGAVGLIQGPETAVAKLVESGKRVKRLPENSSKEDLVGAFNDDLVDIFGKVLVQIAVNDLALAAAEATLSTSIPIVDSFVIAARLPFRRNNLGANLFEKVCILHELWIISSLLSLKDNQRRT